VQYINNNIINNSSYPLAEFKNLPKNTQVALIMYVFIKGRICINEEDFNSLIEDINHCRTSVCLFDLFYNLNN